MLISPDKGRNQKWLSTIIVAEWIDELYFKAPIKNQTKLNSEASVLIMLKNKFLGS